MRRGILASFFVLFFGLGALAAQETDSAADTPVGEPLEEVLPGFRDQAVVFDIRARVLEQNKIEIWNESHKRVTIPGRPVGLNLVGTNVVVAVQFIPYLHSTGQSVLVAQGQIWVEIPNQGIHYQTTMQTIPFSFEEPVYYFPLGSSDKTGDASIEIMLTMHPYQAGGSESGTSVPARQEENR